MPLPEHIHRHGLLAILIFVLIFAALILVWWAR